MLTGRERGEGKQNVIDDSQISYVKNWHMVVIATKMEKNEEKNI